MQASWKSVKGSSTSVSDHAGSFIHLWCTGRRSTGGEGWLVRVGDRRGEEWKDVECEKGKQCSSYSLESHFGANAYLRVGQLLYGSWFEIIIQSVCGPWEQDAEKYIDYSHAHLLCHARQGISICKMAFLKAVTEVCCVHLQGYALRKMQ